MQGRHSDWNQLLSLMQKLVAAWSNKGGWTGSRDESIAYSLPAHPYSSVCALGLEWRVLQPSRRTPANGNRIKHRLWWGMFHVQAVMPILNTFIYFLCIQGPPGLPGLKGDPGSKGEKVRLKKCVIRTL